MKLQIVPARQGVTWVRQGWRVFMRQPLGFAALFAACLMAFVVLRSIPLVGPLALPVLAPAGSLLFMIASSIVLGGKSPVPLAFVAMMRNGRPQWLALLKLGLAYLAGVVATYLLGVAVGGGAFSSLLDAMPEGKPTAEAIARMADLRVQLGFLVWLGLLGLLSVPFWHAPALVHWGRQSWAKSLFFSTMGVWRNRGAFAVYSLVWAGVVFAFMMVSGFGIALLGPNVYPFVGTPLMLALVTVFYASLWFTFADCFASPETPLEIAS